MVKIRPWLTKHDLQVSVINGSETVVVPEEVLGDTPLWKDFLVGQFLSTALHVAKIHVIVNKIWPLGGGIKQRESMCLR